MNPHSRKNRLNGSAADHMARIVGDHGIVARCGDPESLQAAAEDFRRQGVDVLAVGGGDGTNSMVLTAFREAYGDADLPSVAMLRGGTMNTIANGAGVPRHKSDKLLTDLVAAVRAGHPLTHNERGTMDVDGRLAFLFGVGLVAGWLAEYYSRGRPHVTPWTAVETLGASVGSALVGGEVVQRIAHRPVLTLDIDGEHFEARDYLTVTAGTSDHLGLGFRPFFRALDDLDRFHLLALTTTATSLVADLPLIRQGKPIREGRGLDRLVREVRLTDPDGEPMVYMVDGDIDEHPGPLTVKAGPRVRVITGHAARNGNGTGAS